MKKLLLLFVTAALAVTAHARELTFWIGDEKIAPDSEIVFTDTTLTNLGAGMQLLEYKPKLYVSSDIYTSKLMVKATCTSGQNIQLCCGGNCVAGTSVTKDGLKVNSNVKLALDFDYVEMPWNGSTLPAVKATIEAQDAAYPDTRIAFNITMDPNLASIKSVEAVKPVVLTQAGIEYYVPAGGTLQLFSITGTSVLKAAVQGSGVIETSSLSRGVYVYTLATASGNLTGKIIVK